MAKWDDGKMGMGGHMENIYIYIPRLVCRPFGLRFVMQMMNETDIIMWNFYAFDDEDLYWLFVWWDLFICVLLFLFVMKQMKSDGRF